MSLRISDSNPVQFWLTGESTFNETDIYGIDKQLFYQTFKYADSLRTDIKPDSAAAPTWDEDAEYNTGDLAFSTFSGQHYRSLVDGNIGNDPLDLLGGFWTLADYELGIDLDSWNIGTTYQSGDLAFSDGSGTLPFVYQSLIDGNLANDPGGFGAIGTTWAIVVLDQLLYKMLAYVGGTLVNTYDFHNVRLDATNQFVNFDFTDFTLAGNELLRLKIFDSTVVPSFKISSDWNNYAGTWDTSLSEKFVAPGWDGTTLGVWQPFYAKAGSKVDLSLRIISTSSLILVGEIDVKVYATNEDGTVHVSDVDIEELIPFEGSAISQTITGSFTLLEDSARLYIDIVAAETGGPIATDLTLDQIAGVDDVNNEVATSDCIDVQEDYRASVLVEYTNMRDYDNIAYQDTHPIFALRIAPAHFWERQNVRGEEDYSDSKGTVITLRSQTEKQRKISTSFIPAYLHTKLDHIFNHDLIRVEGVVVKSRATYTPAPIDRSTLYPGSGWLTEQDSVLVNIGGVVVDTGFIFDDSFAHPPFT